MESLESSKEPAPDGSTDSELDALATSMREAGYEQADSVLLLLNQALGDSADSRALMSWVASLLDEEEQAPQPYQLSAVEATVAQDAAAALRTPAVGHEEAGTEEARARTAQLLAAAATQEREADLQGVQDEAAARHHQEARLAELGERNRETAGRAADTLTDLQAAMQALLSTLTSDMSWLLSTQELEAVHNANGSLCRAVDALCAKQFVAGIEQLQAADSALSEVLCSSLPSLWDHNSCSSYWLSAKDAIPDLLLFAFSVQSSEEKITTTWLPSPQACGPGVQLIVPAP